MIDLARPHSRLILAVHDSTTSVKRPDLCQHNLFLVDAGVAQ